MGQEASATVKLVARDSAFNRSMKRVRRTMERVRQRMQAVAAAARRMFAVGAIGATGAVVAFGSFEQSMARVKALTESTGKTFAALEDQARSLGKSTVFSANQAAQAMGFLAQAGFTVKEVMSALPKVLSLAAAGQLDMATASDITAKIMRGMRIEAEDLGRTIDILAKAFTTSNTNLVELGEAMKFVGPIAVSSGVSLEETVAAIQALSDAGLGASIAGTGLRTILLKLKTVKADTAFKKLGIELREVGGGFRPLPKIIGELDKAMRRLDPLEKAKLLEIFGLRGGPAMEVLLAKGQRGLERLVSALDDAGGTADRIAKTQLDTLFGGFKLITSAASETAIKIGATLKPTVELLGSVILALSEAFNTLSLETTSFITSIGAAGLALAGIVAILPPLLGALGFLAAAFVKVGFAATAMTKTVTFGKGVMTGLGPVIATVGLAVVVLADQWRRLNDAIREQTELNEKAATSLNKVAKARQAIAGIDVELASDVDPDRGLELRTEKVVQLTKKFEEQVKAIEAVEEELLAMSKLPEFKEPSRIAKFLAPTLVAAGGGDQRFQLAQRERQIEQLKRQRDATFNLIDAAKEEAAVAATTAAAFQRAADQRADAAALEAESQRRDRPAQALFADLRNQLAILRGEITEGQLEVINLANVGTGADKLAEILTIQEQIRKERDRSDLTDEAKALKDAALSAKERLAVELKRVEVLRLAGALTDAEAAKIRASKAVADVGGESLTGRLESADALIRRITQATGATGGGTPAQQTAQSTATVAQQTAKTATATQSTARDTATANVTLRDILDVIRDAISQLPFAGAFS